LKETLSDHVKEVRLSTRLTESPACLITDTFGITPALARIYQAAGQSVPVGKRILERNPNHPLVTGASALQEIDLLREELSKGAASSAQACTAAKAKGFQPSSQMGPVAGRIECRGGGRAVLGSAGLANPRIRQIHTPGP
jgi:HSP90 family molecular chaperone